MQVCYSLVILNFTFVIMQLIKLLHAKMNVIDGSKQDSTKEVRTGIMLILFHLK